MKNLVLILLIFSVFSCGMNEFTLSEETHHLIESYLSDRVPPVLSVDDDIAIRFKAEYELSTTDPVKGAKIIPFTPGQFHWADDHTLVFKPDRILSYDQQYELQLNLKEILSNSETDEMMRIGFQTRPLQLSLSDINQKMEVNEGVVHINILGGIQSNQYTDTSTIQSLLRVEGVDEPLKVNWSHTNNYTSHNFSIAGITRTSKTKDIQLVFNGGKWAPDFKELQRISIGTKSEFKVEDVVIQQEPSRLIKVMFSDPLLENQDLRGLIRINDAIENIRTLIEGNELRIYPDGDLAGSIDFSIAQSIRAYNSVQLKSNYFQSLSIEALKPQLRLAESGVIVPSNSKISFPFEAVNLDTVDIEIFKIYNQNVLQFMQNNSLTSGYNLDQVGKIIHRQKIAISTKEGLQNNWQSFALDLSTYLNKDKGAIYQVRVGFQPSYISYSCDNVIEGYVPVSDEESIMDYRYYDYEGWDNPCASGYYTPDKYVSRNIIFSNVGAIIKSNSTYQYHIAISKISDGSLLPDAKVEFFNYQKIPIGILSSDFKGLGVIQLSEQASFAIVSHPSGTTFVNLQDASSQSITDFNTGGRKSKNGIDAFIYSDRGVYRPGDTIYMYVMLTSGSASLPSGHPLRLTVKDAQGLLKYERTNTEQIDQVYSFIIPTDANDRTGPWNASLMVGGVQFAKRISVETIKPNRLRLAIESDDLIRYSDQKSREIGISSSWLHGAPASKLRVKIDAQWTTVPPVFDGFNRYVFIDPAREMKEGQVTLFDGNLNEQGNQIFEIKLDKESRYPSMINGQLTSRVFEKGGDYSENYSNLVISPYSSYVGVEVPKNEWGDASVKIGDIAKFNTVVLSDTGKPVNSRKLSVGVYDINWQWWYYRGQRFRIFELNSDQHKEAILKTEAETGPDGRVNISINTEEFDYGRKMIRICDVESGHCTGDFFYASSWNSILSSEERNSLSKLTFTANKEDYKVGEDVLLNIPTEEGVRILLSLESENRVIRQEWVDGKKGTTQYSFKAEPSMAPNIYAHATLIQPYDKSENDLPIRMYGVMPIIINNPSKRLQPKLELPAQIQPEETFSFTVSEENGEPMTYTIAIVDEGLLDLTNFKTPDPYNHFYAKRSLGVKTWDVYDDILYGLNGTVDKIISVGGDGTEDGSKGQKKAIRFRPVIFSEGPFQIGKKGKRKHEFKMPNYIGSVRVMVVARQQDAFGNVSVAVPVKSPLMLLPSIPRVISQGEKIEIPVSVFAMDNAVKKVQIEIETTDNLKVASPIKELLFQQQGEETISFDAVVGNRTGIAKINIKAQSGSHRTSQQIEIDIRNPNPILTDAQNIIVQPNETWVGNINVFGIPGSNKGTIELSQFPSINLANRVNFLVGYPYGCIEQTTSSSFVQLYLSDLTDYVSEAEIKKNVNAGIKRILKMQHPGGGFRYWPSATGEVSEWGSSYAGHFLIEARNKGYFVSNDVIRKWTEDQVSRATKFRLEKIIREYEREQAMLDQAYRLYTLSLVGAPNLSAMNLLRTQKDLAPTCKFLLAAAYARSNKKNIALDLIKGAGTDVKPYRDFGFTYGSEVRDMALIAQSLSWMDRKNQAVEVIRKIADHLNSSSWYSTQSIAFGIMTIGQLGEEYKSSKIDAMIGLGDMPLQKINYNNAIFTMSFDTDELNSKSVQIKNNSNKILFASVLSSGQKSTISMLDDKAESKHVQLNVTYKNLDGTSLDISSLEQGMDFYAVIEIDNLNTRSTIIDEMALTQIVPSGWEIRSGRLNELNGFSQDNYDYQDVRDDRIHTFFDLGKSKKFVVQFNAAYLGEYFLPPLVIEAMYDKDIRARTKGQRVSVTNSAGK